MKLSIFNENDRVLLIGEGNFSFSVFLYKHNLPIIIVPTCYEKQPINDTANANIEFLKSHGICVMVGVDATILPEYHQLNKIPFDKIIFNFPHVCSKMRLDKNRQLLREFFKSVGFLLASDGQVLISLCNGQGGTTFDAPKRRWDDSWKIREMAAHGNFVLKTVEPFERNNFPNYTVTGYRGLDKQFNIDQALVHVFIKFETPVTVNFIPNSIINVTASNFPKLQWSNIATRALITDILEQPIFSFDITFSVTPNFKENMLYETLYNNAGNIIINVEFIRSYEFPGSRKITRTYRITYHSNEIPLYRKRVIEIHQNIITNILESNLNVKVSR